MVCLFVYCRWSKVNKLKSAVAQSIIPYESLSIPDARKVCRLYCDQCVTIAFFVSR